MVQDYLHFKIMKKIIAVLLISFIAVKANAQIWQQIGGKLKLIQGADTLTIDSTAKYTTALLKNIRGNVGVSTNTHDSVLVYDDFTRSIKKKLVAGGGWSLTGNAATNPATNFIGTTDMQPFKIRANNNLIATFGTDNNVAIGNGSTATNSYTTAIGGFNASSGFGSTTFGYGSLASGVYGVAAGFVNYATGSYSFAVGNQTTASAASSTSLGEFTNAKSFGETAIGLYNTTYTPTSTTAWSATDRLFGIGNGTAVGARSDALTVLKNGNTIINGTIKTAGYTVATLPTGVLGMIAYVTDATAPTYLGTLTGGGSIKCPVFYNGTSWVSQ